MAKTKLEKNQIIKDLVDKIKKAKIVLFTSFSRIGIKGADVKTMNQIKRQLKAISGEYIVVKKNLLDLALRQSNLAAEHALDIKNFEGSIGLVLGYEDFLEPNKTFYSIVKGMDAFKIYGAFFADKSGTVIGAEFSDSTKTIELAKLPSREVLIVKLLGTMKSPIFLLRGVLDGYSKIKVEA